MAYIPVKRGSKGSYVQQLQNLLNSKGYSLKVDGDFGPLTETALKDYQTKNSLSNDGIGIAGEQTWASLSGTSSAAPPKTAADYLSDLERNKPVYTQPDALKTAIQQLSDYEKNKPAEYQSQWGGQIQTLFDQIMNRPKFSYDFAADPLYQQAKERYMKQGQLAMQDTMGQAAALTGGYGSSYGQSVGQQAYQGYLQQANDVIPGLQQSALQQYDAQGNVMNQNLASMQGMEQTDYNEYQNGLNNYYNELNRLTGNVNNMQDREYQDFVNNMNQWESDRNYYYQKSNDDYAKAQTAAKSAKSGGGGGSSKSKTGKLPGTSAAYSDLTSMINSGQITTVGVVDSAMRAGYLSEAEAEDLYNLIRQKTTKPGADRNRPN
jgi:peptidoglycan hydrolase-like protein with peptidoglycan-binding domain